MRLAGLLPTLAATAVVADYLETSCVPRSCRVRADRSARSSTCSFTRHPAAPPSRRIPIHRTIAVSPPYRVSRCHTRPRSLYFDSNCLQQTDAVTSDHSEAT